ncbi:excalibur calcium-binding domain-containing protein [Arthrobacter sp. SW1]|uniref:excalibur calcium-binding domain-containing protein n=1 Tax=Arthrobacter sp. SW1 TaxID=1920889 RepID=UPI0009F62355|nr:excalibur calcium-binding domain-containing protein [Arthrobacter sp. SW1]
MGAKVSQLFVPETDPAHQVISGVPQRTRSVRSNFAVIAAGAALLFGLAACGSPGPRDRSTADEPTPVVSASEEPSATPSPSATTASATPTPTPTPKATKPPAVPGAAGAGAGAVVGGNVPAPLVKVPVQKPPAPAPKPAPPAPKPVAPAPKPVAPAPAPPKPAVPAPAPPAAYFSSCADARAAGAAPLYAGQPGYRAGLDRDKDGVACE